MKTNRMFASFVMCMVMVFAASSVFAGAYTKTLTIGTGTGAVGSTVTLPIIMGGDTQGQVGGFAFTLTYDITNLQFVAFSQATITFLDPTTFSNANPYITPNNKPQNSIFYQVNSDTVGTLKIAAGSAVAIANGTIFNVQFKILPAFTTGSQTILLKETVLLKNETAGYTSDLNPISVISGMPSMTADASGKYPTMDTFTTTLTNGTVSIGAGCKIDVDGNGVVEAYKDGFLILRYLLGSRGTALDRNIGTGATRTEAEIEAYIESCKSTFDADGNNMTEAYKDGFLILRYMLGSRGAALDRNLGTGATRTEPAVETYIESLK